jgi:hypothetical protein
MDRFFGFVTAAARAGDQRGRMRVVITDLATWRKPLAKTAEDAARDPYARRWVDRHGSGG